MNNHAWWKRVLDESVTFAREDIACAKDAVESALDDLRRAQDALARDRERLAKALADQEAFGLDPEGFLAGKRLATFINLHHGAPRSPQLATADTATVTTGGRDA